MARTRSEKYDDIQAGILRNAARLFARKGYERSSIGDLVEACELSRGAIYHYFDSKEAILFAMLDSLVRSLLANLESAIAGGGAPLEKFEGAFSLLQGGLAGKILLYPNGLPQR